MHVNGPRISVITAVLNGARTVERAICSVLDQQYPHVEYLVQDGGSNDGTLEILARYAERLNWLSEKDDGVYDAMNRAVTRAKGEWVYFLGADVQLRNVLHRVADHLVDPADVYYGDVYRISAGERYAGPFRGSRLARTNISQQAIFYPRRIFENLCLP